mmetsp:Transcript_88753/g.153674  ORF Transcript_88753/g.153674 Transcript_88753/m.153674 type:complete len:80 (+) Transcript_88753:84-323(+)
MTYMKINMSEDSGWGAQYFAEDRWTPIAQYLAAITMFGPWTVQFITFRLSSCQIDYFNGRIGKLGSSIRIFCLLQPPYS